MCWHFLGFYIVSIIGAEEQVADQVQEDKYTGAGAERYMDATFLYAKALAHGSFYLKDIKELFPVFKCLLFPYNCLAFVQFFQLKLFPVRDLGPAASDLLLCSLLIN